MRIARRGLLFLLVVHGVIAVPVASRCCDCLEPVPEEFFAQSDAVFSGEVVAVTSDDSRLHAFIDLLEAWKGEFDERTLVHIVTANNTAECGFPFRVGEETVVFATNSSGSLHTHLCTPTGSLSRAEATDLFGPPTGFSPFNVEFRRGDVNADGQVNISDAVSSLLFQFRGMFEPPCKEALDFDNDGSILLTDAIASLTYQFRRGPPPRPPFPECGKDRDLEPLDCKNHAPCPPKIERHEIVRIERLGDVVEIELFSPRPFPVRALFPILCIGTDGFSQSRMGDGVHSTTLIFTLTPEEFDAVDASALVTVQHGSQCQLDLRWQTLYWDLWVFGPLDAR